MQAVDILRGDVLAPQDRLRSRLVLLACRRGQDEGGRAGDPLHVLVCAHAALVQASPHALVNGPSHFLHTHRTHAGWLHFPTPVLDQLAEPCYSFDRALVHRFEIMGSILPGVSKLCLRPPPPRVAERLSPKVHEYMLQSRRFKGNAAKHPMPYPKVSLQVLVALGTLEMRTTNQRSPTLKPAKAAH